MEEKIEVTIQENRNVRLSLLTDQFGVTFGTVEHIVKGRMFHSDEKVQEAMTEWMNNVGDKILFHTIYNLVPRWNKCENRLDNYIKN